MIPCAVCGEPVVVGPQRYLAFVRDEVATACRRNGCYRYYRERRGGGENTGTARTTQVIAVPGVEGCLYELGRGLRRHDLAPLANGKVKRVAAAGCEARRDSD